MLFSVALLQIAVHFQIVDIVIELLRPLRLHVLALVRLVFLTIIRLLGIVAQVFVVILLDQRLGPLDVDLQLVQEVGTDFQIWPSGVHELQGFEEGPLELLHKVQNRHNTRATLPPDRVKQHTRPRVDGLVDEPNDFFRDSVLFVEDELPVVVEPVEREEF